MNGGGRNDGTQRSDNPTTAADETWCGKSTFLTAEQMKTLDRVLDGHLVNKGSKLLDKLVQPGTLPESASNGANGNRTIAAGLPPTVPVTNSTKAKKGHLPTGGGKGEWAQPTNDGSVGAGDTPIRRGDPSFDEERDGAGGVTFSSEAGVLGGSAIDDDEYKRQSVEIVREYFQSGDVVEAIQALEEVGSPERAHMFVKRAIALAMDRRDREREMVSALLSAAYAWPSALPAGAVERGIAELLDALDDLVLDIPDGAEKLATFAARCVADDVLPPSVIERWAEAAEKADDGSSFSEHAKQSIVAMRTQLLGPRSADRLMRCWGAGAGRTAAEAKTAVRALLKEHAGGGELDEARRRLRELGMPFFHHEVVKSALTMVIENPPHRERLLALIAALSTSGEISGTQVSRGFERTRASLPDLCLDCPGARRELGDIAADAYEAGWLPHDSRFENGGPLGPQTPRKISGLAARAAAMATPEAAHDGSEGAPKVELILNEEFEDIDAERAAIARADAEYKRHAERIVLEYLDSGNADEAAQSCKDLGQEVRHALFVKKAIVLALDRRAKERERVSLLLSKLRNNPLSRESTRRGLALAAASAEDLVLDAPDATENLALFVARAVADDVLPPADVEELLDGAPYGTLAEEVFNAAQRLLAPRHAGERLLRCWGAGAGRTAEDAKLAVRAMLREYADGGELEEARRCLRELAMPFFHHEVVKSALTMAVESPARKERLVELLAALSKSGEISATQVARGFDRMRAYAPDLSLDVPSAPEDVSKLEALAINSGWLVAAA